MSLTLRCVFGHEWESDSAETDADSTQVCPLCRQKNLTPGTLASITPVLARPSTIPGMTQPPPVLETYEILEEIGRGGMGVVYKARHRGHNRVMALKVIRSDRLAHPEAATRFRREARAAGRLSHPNIVLLFDYQEENGLHYLAMEYVPGITLQQLVDTEGALSEERACEYIRQAALGLQHAHEQGLVHRDIKPANLMLTGPVGASRRMVKLLDMGVARLSPLHGVLEESLTTLTQPGVVLGTPDFVAPEQLENPHGADIRADLYSLGCTMYFLVSGQVPFPGGTLIQKLDRQRWENPPSVEQIQPKVRPALGAVVRRLMAKSPDHRFATPGELAETLERLAQGADVDVVWRTEPVRPMAQWLAHRGGVQALHFLPDGRHLLSGGSDRVLRVWDIAEQREVSSLELPRLVTGLAVLSDATLLVATGVTVRLLEWPSWKEIRRLSGHLDTVRALAVSRDGHYAASAGDDRSVRLWDLNTGGIAGRWTGHRDGVTGLAFARDGKTLASAGRDGLLRLWAVPGGRTLRDLEVPRSAVLDVDFCADELHLASAHFDTTVRLWDHETGREMRRFQGHRQMVGTVACSPFGGQIASAGADRTVRWWDPDSGIELQVGEGHTATVTRLAFNANGEWLASAGADGTLCLWAVQHKDPRHG